MDCWLFVLLHLFLNVQSGILQYFWIHHHRSIIIVCWSVFCVMVVQLRLFPPPIRPNCVWKCVCIFKPTCFWRLCIILSTPWPRSPAQPTLTQHASGRNWRTLCKWLLYLFILMLQNVRHAPKSSATSPPNLKVRKNVCNSTVRLNVEIKCNFTKLSCF